MRKLVLLFFFTLACCISATWCTRTVDSHLSASDLTRLQKVFIDGLSSNDLQSIYYATLNVETTKTADKEALCKKVVTLHQDSKLNDFEKDYYLIGANKNLRCTAKLPEALLSKVYAGLDTELATAQEIYYRIATHVTLGAQLKEASRTKVVKRLQELLKKDDTLVNFGYAFNVATELGAGAAFVAERVEDAIVQADEVDGKLLQFEGGLSITALIINGVYRVSKTFNKPVPLKAEQAVKLANYFLSRRSVQTAKGAHVLIEVLKTLSAADKVAPICIQLIGNGQLQVESPTLNIAVVDLLGKALSPPTQNIHIKVQNKKDNKVLAEQIKLVSKSSDKTTYVADLTAHKPSRGIYQVELNADNIYKQTLQFKVLGRVKVQSLEVGIAETDASAATKKQSVSYPNKLKETLTADHTQKLLVKANLLDEATNKPISVHQAFVRLFNKQTEQEIIFVAEQDSSKAYKFDMDVGSHGADFSYHSGLYQVYLIVGDASLANSFEWLLADVQLKFQQESKVKQKSVIRAPLPEIVHQFRAPDKRPPRIVSDIFTGLCLTPLVLLFIFWSKLGINVSNLSFTPSTIGFHLGFGGILGLFSVFWLQLNMFQTLRLLIPIAVFTFLCGNRMLRRIYAQRVAKNPAAAS